MFFTKCDWDPESRRAWHNIVRPFSPHTFTCAVDKIMLWLSVPVAPKWDTMLDLVGGLLSLPPELI